MAVFSLYDLIYLTNFPLIDRYRLLPETKGRSLEEMDIIFGSISAEQRQVDIDKRQRGKSFLQKISVVTEVLTYPRTQSFTGLRSFQGLNSNQPLGI